MPGHVRDSTSTRSPTETAADSEDGVDRAAGDAALRLGLGLGLGLGLAGRDREGEGEGEGAAFSSFDARMRPADDTDRPGEG